MVKNDVVLEKIIIEKCSKLWNVWVNIINKNNYFVKIDLFLIMVYNNNLLLLVGYVVYWDVVF